MKNELSVLFVWPTEKFLLSLSHSFHSVLYYSKHYRNLVSWLCVSTFIRDWAYRGFLKRHLFSRDSRTCSGILTARVGYASMLSLISLESWWFLKNSRYIDPFIRNSWFSIPFCKLILNIYVPSCIRLVQVVLFCNLLVIQPYIACKSFLVKLAAFQSHFVICYRKCPQQISLCPVMSRSIWVIVN